MDGQGVSQYPCFLLEKCREKKYPVLCGYGLHNAYMLVTVLYLTTADLDISDRKLVDGLEISISVSHSLC